MRTYVLKRPIEVAASGAALLLLSPLMGAIAAWVKLDSPGPALFRQQRLGRDQVPFSIIKFRTMSHRNAEDIDQASEVVISSGGDWRITRAGRALRATSLDELPQLVNVLRGDMSLVGPRPVLKEQCEAIPAARLDRFAVRPGLTGLAQIRGRRGLDWLDQLAYDSEYVEHCSLPLDLRIVLRTVAVVLARRGVYGEPGINWRAYRASTPEVPEAWEPQSGTR